MTKRIKPSGNFDKIKIRIVAVGNMQDRHQYSYDQTSYPTFATASVFIIAILTTLETRKVITMNISEAFLNSVMPGSKKLFFEFMVGIHYYLRLILE